jgi:carboxypeptidase D
LIEPEIQYPDYPNFVVNNTYGIAFDPTISDYMIFALNMPDGCLEQIANCHKLRQSPKQKAVCSDAESFCRNYVLGTV